MKDKIFGVLQRVGRSFMLPIAILPVAGLLLGFGSSFTNETTIATYGLQKILGDGTILHALEDISTAICEAICEYDKDLIVYYCAGAVLGDIAESKGLRTASEIFADRAYMDDLSLVNC